MRLVLTRLGAAALAFALALGAVELGLRALAPTPAFRVWPPGLEAVLEPRGEIMHGVGGPSRFRVSSLGFRADERPSGAALSILALGGSTTECLYLDQDEAWPALLQSELARAIGKSVWVANAGQSGHTTRDHVLQLHHLLEQEPRFERVLLLTGVNDLCAWLASGPGAVPEPPDDLARAFAVVPRELAGGPWWQRTALFELLTRARVGWADVPLAQDSAGEVYRTWRAHRGGAHRWIDQLPDSTAVRTDFRAELAALLTSCAHHGTTLVLITQPALWRAGLAPELEERLWMGGVGNYQLQPRCDYYTAGALARGLELFNAELRAFAAEHGLPLLDLARALAGDPECFYDDVHFNEEGSRRVASFLSEGLAALDRN